MNKTYRVVWNATLGVFQAASELAKGRGKTKSSHALKAVLAATGVALAAPSVAATLPTGGNVIAGQGSIQQNGGAMTIRQGSDKLVIDWGSFSIGQGNSVRFVQPGAASAALNRVLGPDVSVIQGALQANGRVFLVNPNGVLFSPTAQVDVGGLVASTLKMSTDDFLSGNYRFSGDSRQAVVNQGRIDAAQGGTVALIAARIVNQGSITADRGSVLMGAGSKVRLDLGGPAQLEVEQGVLDALIENGGAIRADGGNVLLTARAANALADTVISTTGIIEAHSLSTGEDGVVTLLGEQGGVDVAGRIDVSSDGAKGGKVVVTADRVGILDGASIDARGATGGGQIYVGGGWQGKDPAIKQATQTTIAASASLDASATLDGDGGTIVAWSDVKQAGSLTRVDGKLKASGGAQGGDGGKVETSGASLAVSQAVDASAAQGKNGLWLLDPDEVTVGSGLSGGLGDATVSHSAINTSLLGGTDVTIAAGEKIDWQDDFSATVKSSGARLTLKVDDNADVENFDTGIFLNGGIDAGGAGNGKLDLVFDGNVRIADSKDIALNSNGGEVIFSGYVDAVSAESTVAGKLRIVSEDGDVTFSDMVGGTNALGALYVTTDNTAKTYVNGAVVRTHGEQVYDSPVEMGTVQFENPNFDEGTDGWTITDDRFVTGTTKVDGWTSPVDTTYPANNASSGSAGDASNISVGSYTHDVVAGAPGQGDALQLSVNGATCQGDGYCVIRGPYVVSDSSIALAKGESVSFDWKALAGGDAYDVIGYLLNVKTGEAQMILNETGASDVGGTDWATATVTADKAGVYKFVFVAGSYDFTGGKALGGSLQIDTIATSSGPKSVEGASISYLKGLNGTDNDLTFRANEVDLNGPVTGTGNVAFENLDPHGGIEVGGTRPTGGDPADDGILQVSKEDLDALGDGFKSVRIGDDSMSGDITVIGDTQVKDDLILNAGTGDIAVNAGLSARDDAGSGGDDGHAPVIVMQTQGGNVSQNADGVLDADGLVLLGDGATYDLDNAGNLVNNIAGNTGSVSYGAAEGQAIRVGTVTTAEGDSYSGLINENDTNLTADEIDLSADVASTSGTGMLTLKQKTDGTNIRLGGADDESAADNELRLSTDDIAHIRDGFADIAIGDVTSGNIVVDESGATFKDDLSLTADGRLDLQGDLQLIDGDDDADGGTANELALSVTAEGGAQGLGAITADELALRGVGDFDLGRGSHDVGVMAADVGSLAFQSAGDLGVGAVDGLSGIAADEAVSLKTGGDLQLDKGITVRNGPGDDEDQGQTRDDDVITLDVGGKASQAGADAGLDARGLVLLNGEFDLTGEDNAIGTIAAKDTGDLAFRNGGDLDLDVGELDSHDAQGNAITTTGIDSSGLISEIDLYTNGNLNILSGVNTQAKVFLNVGGKTRQANYGLARIESQGLGLNGGDFQLDNGLNDVGTIAAKADRVVLANNGDLTVGELTSRLDGTTTAGITHRGSGHEGDIVIGNAGDLLIDEAIDAGIHNVHLAVTDGKVSQSADGAISAAGLALHGDDFELRNAANRVGEIASDAGRVAFANSGDLVVGSVDEHDADGSVVKTTTGIDNTGDVSLGTGGDLAINESTDVNGNGLFLTVDGTATQSEIGTIQAGGLALNGGGFELRNAGNQVGVIASDAGQVAFANTGNLMVGTLTDTDADGGDVVTQGIHNTGDVSINTGGDLAIDEAVDVNGNDLFLTVAGQTSQSTAGAIQAGGLALNGGDFELRNAGNQVGEIASEAGRVAFANAGDLKVGTLTELDANSNVVKTTTGIHNTGDVSIDAGGDLAVNQAVEVGANKVFLTVAGQAGQAAAGTVRAGGLALNGGDFELRNAGNQVGVIASDAGRVAFANTDDLKVGTLTEYDADGHEVKTTAGIHNTGDVSIEAGGSLAIDEAVDVGANTVFLTVAGKTDQAAAGNIRAGGLALNGGDFELRNAGNQVGEIASQAGRVAFAGAGSLKVGTLTERDANNNVVKTTTGIDNTGDVSLKAGADLAITKAVDVNGNRLFLTVAGQASQVASANIDAAGLALNGGVFELRNAGNRIGQVAASASRVALANTGDLAVGALTERDAQGGVVKANSGIDSKGDVSLETKGDLAIGQTVVAGGTVFLGASGTTTQDVLDGSIKAAGLALTGGRYELDATTNWIGQFASRAGEVRLLNGQGLVIDTLAEYAAGASTPLDQIVGINNTGKLRIDTVQGDIDVRQSVATTSRASDALVLNAGLGRAAGDAAGGNVTVQQGKKLTVGTGGRAIVYSGSVSGSTGLADVIGWGSGNFRYGSDETASLFARPLGSGGTYAVYRERPVLVASTNDHTTRTKVFDGNPWFDGGGLDGFDIQGLLNGDLKSMLGEVDYSVDSAAPGNHVIRISGLQDLGYEIQSDPGNAELAVTPAVDYEAARQSVALLTTQGVAQSDAHMPDSDSLDPASQAGLDELGTVLDGMLYVDLSAGGATQVARAASAGAAADAAGGDAAAADEAACAGGDSGRGCVQYPPQTVFVVQGGIRVPGTQGSR